MLRLTLQINSDEALLDVSIRRLSPDNPTDGQPCRYLVEKITNKGLIYIGTLTYEYGDAKKLSIKVLEMDIKLGKALDHLEAHDDLNIEEEI